VSLVLDASLTLSWYFDDERTPAGEALLEAVGEEGAVVPALWRYEVENGMQMAVRRKRISTAYRDISLAELRVLPITIERAGDDVVWTAMIGFADRFGLTIYDAAYIELAQRRGLPLATGDRAMRSAARALKIELIRA